MEYNEPSEHMILCCQCGTAVEPNPANMCINCIRNEVDITEGIPKNATINFCRNCEKYLQPPNHWVAAHLESRELLSLCLKKLKGLNKVRLIDASFIWTEPHSKRVKLKLTIQKEVFAATILQQVFPVEFIVAYVQCPECAKLAAKNTWKAMVQVRQKVNHKRTFLYLEQLILKHNAHKDTINIQEAKDGLDFFFTSRSHAVKFVDFLTAIAPVRTKTSEQLISMDIHSSTSQYKFTFSVELVPICKDDLVCLPSKVARSLSNIPQLVLCSRISNSVHFVDPNSLQTVDLSTPIYWRNPFSRLASVADMVEFIILDIEPSGTTRGKFVLADATVVRSSDFGVYDTSYFCRTHLGAILQPGDTVLGYHLSTSIFNDDAYEDIMNSNGRTTLADVVLVKKTYPARRKKNKPRPWRLKTLDKVSAGKEELLPKKAEQERIEADYEMFLRDLEVDPELRSSVNLYKAQHANTSTNSNIMQVEDTHIDDEEEEVEDFPEINIDELLDDMEEMTIDDNEEDNVVS